VNNGNLYQRDGDGSAVLIEALVVSYDADLSRVSSRDENEIRGRQCETNRPLDRCVGQRIGTGGDVVNGERIFGALVSNRQTPTHGGKSMSFNIWINRESERRFSKVGSTLIQMTCGSFSSQALRSHSNA